MTNVPPDADTRSWPIRLINWFLGQDLSTKLLVYICAGVYFSIAFGGPKVRSWMNEDIDRITGAHHETMTKVIESWDRHNQKTIEAFREDQERDQKLLERLLGEKRVAAGAGPLARP